MNALATDRKPIPEALEGAALIDIKVVRNLCGFASSSPIYDRLREKAFPEPIRLSKRCTRWRMRDVRAWLEAQGAVQTKAEAT